MWCMSLHWGLREDGAQSIPVEMVKNILEGRAPDEGRMREEGPMLAERGITLLLSRSTLIE